MPFPMTYYTNIYSTVMFSSSSNLAFDLVFLKMWYLDILSILCACNYYLKLLQISSWTAMGLGFVKHFIVKSHFTCSDEATSSSMFLLNSLYLLF
jgi:hypothetical protein